MKIQSSSYARQYDKKESGEFKPNFDEHNESLISNEPAVFNKIKDEVILSEKGIDYYRESVIAMCNQAVKGEKPFIPDNYYDDIESDIYRKLVGESNALKNGNGGTNDSVIAFVTAYANLYDEIVRGYEDGSREVWLRVGTGWKPEDFRLVTKDEELAALKKAADEIVDFMANGAKIEEAIIKEMTDAYKRIEAQKGNAMKFHICSSSKNDLDESVDVKALYKELIAGAINTINSQYYTFTGDLSGLVKYALNGFLN